MSAVCVSPIWCKAGSVCLCLFNVYKVSSVLCVSVQYEYIRLLCVCSKNMKKEVLKDKRGGFLCPCRHLSNSGWVGPTCQQNSFEQPQSNTDLRQAIPIEWSYFCAEDRVPSTAELFFRKFEANLWFLKSSLKKMIFTFMLLISPKSWLTQLIIWDTQTHAASGVCGRPLTMASSKHHSENEENVLDWSSTHCHSHII